jgi:hypothetical protein
LKAILHSRRAERSYDHRRERLIQIKVAWIKRRALHLGRTSAFGLRGLGEISPITETPGPQPVLILFGSRDR